MAQKLLTVTVLLMLSGCATTANNASATGNNKVENKISMAIGREIGNFKIVNSQSTDAPTGYNGMQYTVKTNDGATFKCEILEPSGLGKVATWGMASGADAMCTDFTKGSSDIGKTNNASCNALLRAAGKC
ncbi:MAG: hypothetical protein Q8N35_02350 [Methylococcaceae bacterium]|nr:hypothetical protein [Methylococcaceae bacterium]MDZ4156821.1 hypothetical protein [Methylococcales bacterium]MDP2391731.1 hypothetical protein [Methylococcaceae bacterium]MDP3018405.1 hypothetical protein [Methylococcaceae bacterium]MDP3389447.1 hypothetical protein [Methylococcaceae bacterium]